MNRIVCSIALASVALLGLTACNATPNADACDEIERAVGKSVVTVSDVVLQPLSAGSLEAAAAEVEGYLEPLRQVEASGDLEQPHADVLARMDEVVVAIRAGDIERIGDLTDDLTKIAIDVKLACD